MEDNFDSMDDMMIELIDDENNKYQLEHLHTLEYEGRTFMAFAPLPDEDEDEDEEEEIGVIILESQEEDGEEFFVTVDDDELLEQVFELFMREIEETEDEI